MDTTDAHDSTVELVELQGINCVKCGGALEAQCAEWRSEHPLVAHNFACPYCTRPNGMEDAPARLLAGHQADLRTGGRRVIDHGQSRRREGTIAGRRGCVT